MKTIHTLFAMPAAAMLAASFSLAFPAHAHKKDDPSGHNHAVVDRLRARLEPDDSLNIPDPGDADGKIDVRVKTHHKSEKKHQAEFKAKVEIPTDSPVFDDPDGAGPLGPIAPEDAVIEVHLFHVEDMVNPYAVCSFEFDHFEKRGQEAEYKIDLRLKKGDRIEKKGGCEDNAVVLAVPSNIVAGDEAVVFIDTDPATDPSGEFSFLTGTFEEK